MEIESGGEVSQAIFDLLVALIRQVPRDLSLTSRTVLATLERSGPQRLGDVAASQGVTQPAMTALVNQLCHLGFVERQADPDDGRVVLVALSRNGMEQLNRQRHEMAAEIRQAIEVLPAEDQDSLHAAVGALHRLVDALTAWPARLPAGNLNKTKGRRAAAGH